MRDGQRLRLLPVLRRRLLYFSGRYPEPTLALLVDRIATYYPRYLSSLALYVGVAALLFVGLRAERPARRGAGMSESSERDERHKARMQRKKALMDEKIAEAQDQYGLLLVHTGNGKGKSSSAFGMLARALGHGMKVGVVQFIKGAASTGEEAFFRRFPDEVRYHVMGEGFTWETQDRQRDIAKAREAWAVAAELLSDPEIGRGAGRTEHRP